jgi:hypothetical protein
MKVLHRLIVTSDTYKLASQDDSQLATANSTADPDNAHLWHFPLRRLEAEPIWDAIFAAAGTLDTSVGGPSFDVGNNGGGRRGGGGPRASGATSTGGTRRAAYLIRGFSTSRDVVPNFLQVFDVDDGRVPCPMRTRTVTAPQALFMMNADEIENATAKFAERLKAESNGDLKAAVDLAYRFTLARQPSPAEANYALAYLDNDPNRLKNFAWLLFNLDEFVYVR